jgi:GT2 family glycosyltransferase
MSVIFASIVLFNNNRDELSNLINLIISDVIDINLFLIDNSPDSRLKGVVTSKKIQYFHFPSNLGFGAGHNIAIKKTIELGGKYHFIINPDINFGKNVMSTLVEYIIQDPSIGMIMPEILNYDGSIQYLPKLLPSPLKMILRKANLPFSFSKNIIERYELRNVPKNQIYSSPLISGCFALLNIESIKDVGFYDEKYFMYMEDFDLSRRIYEKYKTIYFPKVSVFHGYQSGANKNVKLFLIFCKSVIIYFNKWGWFFDAKRHEVNRNVINELNIVYNFNRKTSKDK